MRSTSSEGWTLITVSYNSASQLRRCWSSVDLDRLTWIVVDNASGDDSVAVARELGAHVIPLGENVGFGAANNVGLSLVESEWTAFVNPDVVVGAASDFDRLAAVARANCSLIAPQLLNVDGTEQPNARGLPYIVDKFAHRSVPIPGARLDDYVRGGLVRPTYVAWAIGAAICGETETVRRLGGWDERYFIYYEDHDFGLRAWRAGTSLVLDPSTRWIHEWQRATRRFELIPWKHELRAAWTFYATYPSLRKRGGSPHDPWLQNVERILWSAAGDA